MPLSFPLFDSSTRTAIISFPRYRFPAFNTVFRKLAGRTYLFPMNFFMTRYTDGNTVINIKSQFGIIRKRFDMMCLQKVSLIPTHLASKIIPTINRLSPCSKFRPKNPTCINKTCPSFPMTRFISNIVFRSVLVCTRFRTEFSNSIKRGKFCITPKAGFNIWGVSARPAFSRTIFGIWSICSSFKFLAAYFTDVFNTGSPMFTSNLVKTLHRTTFRLIREGMKRFSANGANNVWKFPNIQVVPLQKPSIGFNFPPASTFTEFHTYILDLQQFIDNYCAVVLERFKDATGKEPVRINAST